VPTIFNLLGPLANPAGAPFQVVGVGKPELRPLLAESLQLLGTTRALVVTGEDGLDEVTISGPTRVTEVTPAGLRNFSWTPADFGVAQASLESLQASDADESAATIAHVLNGALCPARDIVVVNAAAALWTAGRAATPREAAELAKAAIDSGAAYQLLLKLIELSNA
jgi:anthranilate phosphoribosyltransferase